MNNSSSFSEIQLFFKNIETPNVPLKLQVTARLPPNLAERKAAARYFNALEDIGLLKARKVGKEKIFLNQRLFELFSQKSKR